MNMLEYFGFKFEVRWFYFSGCGRGIYFEAKQIFYQSVLSFNVGNVLMIL